MADHIVRPHYNRRKSLVVLWIASSPNDCSLIPSRIDLGRVLTSDDFPDNVLIEKYSISVSSDINI